MTLIAVAGALIGPATQDCPAYNARWSHAGTSLFPWGAPSRYGQV